MRIVSAVAVKVIHKLRFDFYYIRTYVLIQVLEYGKNYMGEFIMKKIPHESVFWKFYWAFMAFQLPVRIVFLLWTFGIIISIPSIVQAMNVFQAFFIYIFGILIYCGITYLICRSNKQRYLEYKQAYAIRKQNWINPEQYNKNVLSGQADTYSDDTTQGVQKISEDYDTLEGHEFEYYCAQLLRDNGFQNVEVTQGSGDHGIDILAEYHDVSYAIQCKCYTGNIGNSAVQQAYTGRNLYHKDIAVVLTNRYFTTQAIKEAESLGVKLWDREKLPEIIRKSTP